MSDVRTLFALIRRERDAWERNFNSDAPDRNRTWYPSKNFMKDDPCVYCGRRVHGKMTWDHIDARIKPRDTNHGRMGLMGNAARACGNCNRHKGQRGLVEFLLYFRKRKFGSGIPWPKFNKPRH